MKPSLPLSLTFLQSVAVSSVCSCWRELALSSPSLWANLTVLMHITNVDQVETLAGSITDTVTRYLARSGDWPLRLSLSLRGICHRPTQQAHCWKIFRFRGDQPLTDNILSQRHFPLLAELDVDLALTSRDLNIFEHCLRLHAHTISWPVEPILKVCRNQLDHLTSRGQLLTDLAEAFTPAVRCNLSSWVVPLISIWR
ncbi:hypothetical protein BDP27DRAFT_1019511 [Rhodocollybia butyracea]|uniref:F-box domain-containing protein n=1 Tax=Rhodocollybia butyracea TaxID=206335 RepID=A0A9P5U579_9AGAR|nr:hypothetical protein BDP27DRAFT_1019511 [Rhodocollybia butyracea]